MDLVQGGCSVNVFLTPAPPSYQPSRWAEPCQALYHGKIKPQWVSKNVENIPQESMVPMVLPAGGSQTGEGCSGMEAMVAQDTTVTRGEHWQEGLRMERLAWSPGLQRFLSESLHRT